VTASVGAVLRAPLAPRAHRELLFCLVGVLIGAVGFAIIVLLLVPGTAVSATRGATIFAVLLVVVVATGAARRLSSVFRGLTARLLGERVAAPQPLDTDNTPVRRMRTRLRDGTSWRAVAYTLLRLAMAALELYAVLFWVSVIDLTYPFWWQMFRNHPPNVQLSPAWFVTPFGPFRVGTFAGTFLVFAVGAVMVLAAPWVTRGSPRWTVGSSGAFSARRGSPNGSATSRRPAPGWSMTQPRRYAGSSGTCTTGPRHNSRRWP
jgi:hypothetical protein